MLTQVNSLHPVTALKIQHCTHNVTHTYVLFSSIKSSTTDSTRLNSSHL